MAAVIYIRMFSSRRLGGGSRDRSMMVVVGEELAQDLVLAVPMQKFSINSLFVDDDDEISNLRSSARRSTRQQGLFYYLCVLM